MATAAILKIDKLLYLSQLLIGLHQIYCAVCCFTLAIRGLPGAQNSVSRKFKIAAVAIFNIVYHHISVANEEFCASNLVGR